MTNSAYALYRQELVDESKKMKVYVKLWNTEENPEIKDKCQEQCYALLFKIYQITLKAVNDEQARESKEDISNIEELLKDSQILLSNWETN